MVEDGRPFCPHCRAPQINVPIPLAGESGIAIDSATIRTFPEMAGRHDAGARLRALSDRDVATRAALKAGLLGIIIGMIPLLGLVLTGGLAVYFYRREMGHAPATGMGARLGGAAGVVVSAINAIFTLIVIYFHAEQKCIDGIMDVAQKVGMDTSSPQFQASLHEIFTLSGIASSFIVVLLLATAGGALAATLFRQSRG